MKLIAHRGASMQFQENSIESLVYAAQIGAYAVECDIRQTKDKEYVIFHDHDLSRMAGVQKEVTEVTLQEMKHALNKQGYCLVTLSDLIENYKEETPILLHIKLNDVDINFVNLLRNCGIDFICGVQRPEMAKIFSTQFPKNRILAFTPQKENYNIFAQNGAGIIRLWEHWLPAMDINEVKNTAGNPEVWIMSCDENGSMNGNTESLNHFKSIGADGVLLNDISLAVEWIKNQ